ncbi:MAG TPA: hypothetical protein VH144_00275 [Candidatus Saccharimonadales bacterium]|jgi:hypothetical protein|nr:hypothetical protein [Candidatus Saccharimonadales bacterium]
MGERKPWFRTRTYGNGWYPASIEGWLAITVWLLVIIGSTMVLLALQLRTTDPTHTSVGFAVWMLIAAADTAVLFILSRKKGERLQLPWRTRQWRK